MIKKLSELLVDHRRVAILVLLLTVLSVGAGVTHLEKEVTFQNFEIGVEEEEKFEYIKSEFSTGPSNETVTQIIVRDENVLDKETLIKTLELQKKIRQNETVEPTLSENRSTVGIANMVARAVIRFQGSQAKTGPTLEKQISVLESMNENQINTVTSKLLSQGQETNSNALALMPNDYETGSTNASATMIGVFQTAKIKPVAGNTPEPIIESQEAVQELVPEDSVVVGKGIVTSEMKQSRQDTLSIVGPLALVFVLLTLVLVYRDLVDIVLSLMGIILVQVWTFGVLGWIGIAFNPVLIAIPVLLIGLSIDYGIHVFMRYREIRETEESSVAEAMKSSLGGVGVALIWVTVTTVIGFLSNLVSPVVPIQELGIISAVGIIGALVVFGLFIPPVKVELDSVIERFGFDRHKKPIGVGEGRVARLISVGSTAAKKAPVIVLVATVVLTAVTALGASQVSTSFEPEDNIPGKAPEWTEKLPQALEPGEYTAKKNLEYVNNNFVRPGSQVEILVEGDITQPETLEKVVEAEQKASEKDTVVLLANGKARTRSPVTVMERVASKNTEFRKVYYGADTDGDGIPDQNIKEVYDTLYEAAPKQAKEVLHRSESGYEAFRISVWVEDGTDGSEIIEEMGGVAGVLEGDGRQVTATGKPIIDQIIQSYLLKTILTSLAITLVIVVALLMVAYRIVHGSAVLGLVTLLPITFVVSWIIGTMYVLGYPLSVLTAMVASITIGIGIDYSIHISERFHDELGRSESIGEAITKTTRGTGAALLGSGATTAAGFGVLAFALNPMLQQFGTITAIMILYAFLASVLVLPSLLVLWARYIYREEATVKERKISAQPGGSD